jgi:hypothetical protein
MRLIGLSLLCLVVLPGVAEAGKKNQKKGGDEPAGPGWHEVGSNGGSCYYPPDWGSLTAGPKRVAWQEARDAMMSQWRGDRGDGVQFPDKVITDFETVMLAKPERVELVAAENLEQCEKAMKGAGTDAWQKWLVATPGRLTEGECPYAPMDYTLYDYLSINNEWQIPVNVCKGNKILIHGTENDMFQIADGGPWINVAGDSSMTDVSGLPCNLEGCVRGQLIMRFKGESGVESILPVGIEREFLAPEHGVIHVMINDDSWTDNKYKVEKGLEHHTGIEYKPAGG